MGAPPDPDPDPGLTACDLEPITRPDRIQSFGFLLAMNGEWIVVRASTNVGEFTGIEAAVMLGATLDSLVDRDALHAIRNRMTGLSSAGGSERLYSVELVKGKPRLDLAIHYSGKLCILEGELAGIDKGIDAASLVRAMVARVGKQTTLADFHRTAARQVRTLTAFDRVLVYRFLADGAGEVIAEAIAPDMSSFLGLHFPASDIPVQARALYVLNSFRIIADVHSETPAIVGAGSERHTPLDLSLAVSRAVSPVHIEYLRNMGVAASLSISIIVEGVLWGLIACHHRTPLVPAFVVRTGAELFGQMYSLMLETRLRQTEEKAERTSRETIARVLRSIEGNYDLLSNASWLLDELRDTISCDGVVVIFDSEVFSCGATPEAADIKGIAQMVRISPEAPVFATDNIAALRTGSIGHTGEVAGVLCIPISRSLDDCLMLFRREYLRDVKWAGQPVKVESRDGAKRQLSPRASFAAFTESIRGHSRSFSRADFGSAETLRSGLMAIMFRGSNSAEVERKQATQRQELLIAELNHRVRNVLALIRGLISQTEGEEGDAASYVKSLSGRVQALARAHDRVTRQNWGPGPLNAIFEDEIAAYVPDQRDRFTIRGTQVQLQPQAFSTFALIIHELVTNSSKYGSLSESGRVEVTLQHKPGKGLYFKWCEIDGPTVLPPTRRGFGSVIIERVVPFDLQGTAEMRFLATGVEADFFIPERHISLIPVRQQYTAPVRVADGSTTTPSPLRQRPLDGLSVLLVEDNLIVALEAEDMLRALGAQAIHTASTIVAALLILDTHKIHFAVLDINLGFETSLDLASRLRASTIPFIFASGYGENINLGEINQATLAVSKPYDREQLGFAITQTLDGYAAQRVANYNLSPTQRIH